MDEPRAEKHAQDRTGIIFRTTKGKSVRDAYIRKMMRQKAVKAGIEKIITFHGLRHTALTQLYEKTKDIRLVQQVSGHANIST
ncbi:MAG: tyrosine-type recombinase/integrase [Spirochaetales bacterium]|nr:tyrosine-type recombinase/integrase [Spirochaetales bacterium]